MMIDDGRARPYKEDDAENSVDQANLFIPGTFWDAQQKNNVAMLMCVAGWIRAKVTKRGLVTIPSLKVDRLLCERAAQLSSPLLHWKDTAVQLGKTLPAVQLCTSLVPFSAKISSPLLHEDTAVQNFAKL